MMKVRISTGLLAVGLFLCGNEAFAGKKPTPEDILRIRPHQEGVVCSTPTAEQTAACEVELLTDPRGGSGWLLKDPQGRPLRRIYDTNGDKKPDVWSFYSDGIEVYREIDSDFDQKPDQFRWLNSGGMKWGVDLDKDGRIDSWRMISPEEVSQELVQALLTRDFARFEALMISPAEVRALELPAREATRIQELHRQAQAKFQDTLTKLTNLSEKSRWEHLEAAPPQCMPADTIGSKYDMIKYPRATVLIESNGKHDWVQTGEMIRVGVAWRLVDAPAIGDGNLDGTPASDPELQALLNQLRVHDANPPKSVDAQGPNGDVVAYNIKRADLLEQIVAKVKPDEREQYIRQLADNLSAAAQNSPEAEKTAFQRLVRLEEQIVTAVPKSALSAYIVFRRMSAENASKMAKPGPDINKVLEQWVEKLTTFIDTYPRAEDAPEALMQLGMVSEFLSQEIAAKKWYAQLSRDFAEHPLGVKSAGALRRLELEGKPLELSGTLLAGGGFNLNQLQGKLVIVYYWTSRNKERCFADFASLKALLETYGSKGLELVCVNLDDAVSEPKTFLEKTPSPGIHLYQSGGLDSTLATQYGIMALPYLFLVDKEGKVISRSIQQVSSLEEEVKKKLN